MHYNKNCSSIPRANSRFSIRRTLRSRYRYSYELLVDSTVVENDSHYRFLCQAARMNGAEYLAKATEQQGKEGVAQ